MEIFNKLTNGSQTFLDWLDCGFAENTAFYTVQFVGDTCMSETVGMSTDRCKCMVVLNVVCFSCCGSSV